jgi:nitroimidazol reductase NimA-like FMN-containing flavoprotein (pyridoxamine 5'-phosphate oxidase superfamily)
MNKADQEFVLHVLDTAPDLTLATIRPDGYPQATTVSFAHEDMTLYAGIGRNSQKADNIRCNGKVSLTVNLPYHDWREIRGLSMSAIAELLEDPEEAAAAAACLERRFPAVEDGAGRTWDTKSCSCGSGRRWCRSSTIQKASATPTW